MDISDISDEVLTAYLDGEMDAATSERITETIEQNPDLTARLECLQVPMAAIRQSFEKVAALAPDAALLAMIETNSRPAKEAPSDRRWIMLLALGAAASILLVFGMGLLMGRSLLTSDSDRDWRVAVAEYQALYVEDTLRFVDLSLEERRLAVERVVAKLGTDVPLSVLEDLDGLTFKRAQLLEWQGAPLAQFAFLNEVGKPFAFCVTSTIDADQPVETMRLKNLALSSWIKVMVIGGSDSAFNATIAGGLSKKL